MSFAGRQQVCPAISYTNTVAQDTLHVVTIGHALSLYDRLSFVKHSHE